MMLEVEHNMESNKVVKEDTPDLPDKEMRKHATTIRVEPSTYNHRHIPEDKEKEPHKSTNIAKSNLTMGQSHWPIRLSQEGSEDEDNNEDDDNGAENNEDPADEDNDDDDDKNNNDRAESQANQHDNGVENMQDPSDEDGDDVDDNEEDGAENN